ncbi:MAG TPA: TRAP transporter large permease subunit [Hyphomicrobiaceae bacterium]|nr:TRAP transporter large permease subunit [Hyphomicrobiaceae bacterium]
MQHAPDGIRSASPQPWIGAVETLLGGAVALVAATILLFEVGLLFWGVVARYVFHQPLVWADELASTLFVWLSVLGAVIAMQRGAHMRLTAFISRAAPATRQKIEVIILLVVAAFVCILAYPAIEYSLDEAIVRTPGLGISNSWRASAVAVGAVLMAIFSLLRLPAMAPDRSFLATAVIAFVVACAALWWARPIFMGLGNYNLSIFFVLGVGVAVAMGVPIAFAFGIATVGYVALATRAPLTVIVSRMDEGMSHLLLLSIPLFVLLGILIDMTGMARAMVGFLASLLGHVRGGLSYVLLGAMYLVSGISGAKAADMAAVAPVLFPEMKARGMKPGELVSLLAASGAMAETIPPSVVLIVIGSVASVSIAALFTGGLLPAAVLALALAVVAYFRSSDDDLVERKRATGTQIARAFVISVPALILPFLIRAAVVEGVATAVEVSTIGIAYTIAVGIVVYRQFDPRRIWPMLIDTVSLSGAILFIVGTATAMAWALTQSGFSHTLATSMAKVPGGAVGFMAFTIVVFVILGSVLEGVPALVLLAPLLFPIARTMGIHDVHYSMVVILAMGVGLFAPPFGVGFFTACAIGNVDPDEAMSRIWPYLGALLIGVVVVAAIPWISIGFL